MNHDGPMEELRRKSQAEEMLEVARDTGGVVLKEDKSEKIKEIERRRGQLVAPLDVQLTEARDKGDEEETAEIQAKIDEIWMEHEEQIRAIEKRS